MDPTKAAIVDFVFTAFVIFSTSWLGGLTTEIATASGVPSAFVLTVILFVVIIVMMWIGDHVFSGACTNPIDMVAFYNANELGENSGDSDTLLSIAIRLTAQAAGAVVGTYGIMVAMPLQYKYMLGGPSLNVGVHSGAIAEGVLGFIHCLSVLFIFLRGPQSDILKALLVAVDTIPLIIVGEAYTGPSMNPAQAFGWAYVNGWNNAWEDFYVYWIWPMIGAILASEIFCILSPYPPMKEKKKA